MFWCGISHRVDVGEVLFRLDPAPFRIAVAKAEADLAKVATTFMHMRAELAEAQTEVGEFRIVASAITTRPLNASGTYSNAV